MGLWWVPIGLAAWSGVAIMIALFIGPVLRRCAAVRDAVDQRWMEAPESSLDEPQAEGPAVVRPRDPHNLTQDSAPTPRH